MPTYDYGCSSCGTIVEKIHRISESPEVICPQCKTVMERRITTSPYFSIRGGSPTIAWKEKRLRMKKQDELKKKQQDRYGHLMPKVVPNIAGVRQESWSDCQKLAKECGLNSDSYAPMVEKEKKKKPLRVFK